MADAATAGTRRAATRVFIILCSFLTLVQINRVGGGVIANGLIDQRGISPAALGGIIGAMSLAAAAVQIPMGVLFDRYGARITTSVLSLIAVGGIIVFAVAETATALTGGRILIGIGHAGAVTTVYLIVLGWTPPDRVATISARMIAISGALSGTLATAPLAIMLQSVGFTQSFLTLAAAILIMTALIYFCVRDHPPGIERPERPPEKLTTAFTAILTMMRNPDIRGTLIMASCFAAPFATIGGLWAGPYLREVHGLSQTHAGYVLLAMVLVHNAGTLGFGPLDRMFNSRKKVVLASCAAMIVTLGVLAILPNPPLWLALVFLLLFCVTAPFFVVLAAHCRGFVPDHHAGRAITGMSLVGVGTIFLIQWVTGFIVDFAAEEAETAYRLVFATVAGLVLIAALFYARVRDIPPLPPGGS
ncbi:MFS transporter [Nisaea acidiphila]|uniref:MFS transporter n=1 Tax=Nisaea acidiphila TaxID=1862145 RepID=A0A9J7APN5_9PROT|nr:MFS transporter [Nisaea acidiphila]UUX49175.1 MFS transporter [Nisaea acidiphila]